MVYITIYLKGQNNNAFLVHKLQKGEMTLFRWMNKLYSPTQSLSHKTWPDFCHAPGKMPCTHDVGGLEVIVMSCESHHLKERE